MDDLPRTYVIRESSHRIHNPFTSARCGMPGTGASTSAGVSLP